MLLKKVELKFHSLVEMRQVFAFYFNDTLIMQETKIRRENKEILTEILRKRVGVEKQERGEKIQVTIDRKKKLVVHAGIR